MQQGFFKFNAEGAVSAYDLTLPSVKDVLDIVLGDQSNPVIQKQYVNLICENAQKLCTGGNQQWISVNACISDLSTRNYGTFSDAWSDTVVCRYLHMVLSRVDPLDHCPHVGPSGGMKCVDYPFDRKYVLDNKQLFGSETPFFCPSKQPNPSQAPTQSPHTCTVNGRLRCVAPGQPQFEMCDNGRWSAGQQCASPLVCKPSAADGDSAYCDWA